jgi:transcriptional regulator with XRE-family HTH domain
MSSTPLRDRLKELRVAAGLSQRELCRRMGVDPSYVTRLERGEREPSADVLRRWAEACGVQVAVLDPAAGLPELLSSLRPSDADRVRRYADALGRLDPGLPPGPLHPGDIALSVVETAARPPIRP